MPQWYAVVNAEGELVSSGTVVADPLPEGLTAVAVAAAGPGQVWDPVGLGWVTPEPVPVPPAPVNVLADLSVVAGDDSKTLDQKLTQIVQILAAAGAPKPNPQGGPHVGAAEPAAGAGSAGAARGRGSR